MKYYILVNGNQVGPVERESLLSCGLTPSTLVWREGMQQWQPANELTELSDLFFTHGATPPPPHQENTIYGEPQTSAGNQGLPPDNHMTAAVVWTVVGFCCCGIIPSIFGILAIIAASNSSSMWQAGQYKLAQAKADEAAKWNRWALITAILVPLITIMLYVFIVILTVHR